MKESPKKCDRKVVSIRLTPVQFEAIKIDAVANGRSMSAHCAFILEGVATPIKKKAKRKEKACKV